MRRFHFLVSDELRLELNVTAGVGQVAAAAAAAAAVSLKCRGRQLDDGTGAGVIDEYQRCVVFVASIEGHQRQK
ncbi:hypothetical protein VI817_007449 [Penicillium citrinum]|nr:hypothetical protein VI817_007449 [Penicillium citrinum]